MTNLADTSEFQISTEPSPWGAGFEMNGSNGDATFNVAFEYGFELQEGPEIEDRTLEPDTFYIEWIGATEGQKLGSAALVLTIAHAQEKGFSVARMTVINPRVIGMVEKLNQLGIINERYYLRSSEFIIEPRPATADFPELPDLASREQAIEHLEANARKRAEIESRRLLRKEDDVYDCVDCVITF